MNRFIAILLAAGLVFALGSAAQAATIQIGPGADLGGTPNNDTANQERLNVDRTDTAVLAAGTYDVLDFQLNVSDADTGDGNAGTITPMLLMGSPGSYTTLWVGDAFDPTVTGQQTAATYASGVETFTVGTPGEVFAGLFTGNNGSAVPVLTTTTGTTDHDGNGFTAPTGAGDTVDGFSHVGLGRAYAFEINVDADIYTPPTPPVVTTSNGDSSAVSTDLLETDFGSVVASGLSLNSPFPGDGPAGTEPVLRDGTATDTTGYANGSTTAVRVSDGAVVTYTLDTSVNTLGYQIDRVDLFHGWKDGGRDRNIDFDVHYATVGAPGTFIPILLGGDSGNYASTYGRTSTVPGGTNTFLATDAAAVRITFNSIENGYGGMSEIDVLGSAVILPPIPEPATMCALGLAVAGLGGYIRKRKRA